MTVIDFLSGNAVRTSWYKIYSATVALVSICVAQGDNGYAILDCRCFEALKFHILSDSVCSAGWTDQNPD